MHAQMPGWPHFHFPEGGVILLMPQEEPVGSFLHIWCCPEKTPPMFKGHRRWDGVNEPSSWQIFARNSLFPFFLRSRQTNKEEIAIDWIVVFCKRSPSI